MTVPFSPSLDDIPADESGVFDVRSLLELGIDPYDTVISAAAAVAPGGRLTIDAPFNPTPLRRAMAARGFSSRARKLEERRWRVVFLHDGAIDWENRAEAEILPEGAMQWPEADGLHLDVRRLSPPEPLRVILRLVETMRDSGSIVVHHDRDPVFLAPELAERGWRIARIERDPADIRLWLEPEKR
ncbi:DUF2249 domain-containing protein [Magnetospirillum molischianum]|uniref:DUF2249 domain-containing protein n=1 Tax=Magnetospirillum molischianum DSM 120 TaxID=1150626 RepID=H8FP89_MAGML|nr:DUF2249 domain-containing protein [Magnetospirillum molischianum]CCG40177.1 conserved hypothetical protein [Magnetospirillum molischianum DSM 120]